MTRFNTFSIPGRMKVLVSRPNLQGQYVLVHVKLPYKGLEEFFSGAKGRYYVNSRMIQLEAEGQTYNSMIVQNEEDHDRGYFELEYSPKGDNPRPLSDYLGPKKGDWTHEGEKQETRD